MKLPDSLVKIRSQLAEEHLKQTRRGGASTEPEFRDGKFKAGFDALYSHLTEAAGEFDEKACREEYPAAYEAFKDLDADVDAYVAVRKDQFEQDRARIGLAEYTAKVNYEDALAKTEARDNIVRVMKAHEEEFKQLEGKLASTNDYVKMTETRLAESKKESAHNFLAADKWQEAALEQQEHANELEDKLTAALERLAEVSGHDIGQCDFEFQKLQDKLTAAEARIAELEDQLEDERYESMGEDL